MADRLPSPTLLAGTVRRWSNVGGFAERARRMAFSWEDRLFDWRNKVDTKGVIQPSELAASGDVANVHATAYQAVWCRNLRVLLRQAGKVGIPPVFIDIGSGKGKACFYAAPRFRHVIGVEYSALLVDAANANLRRSGRTNIEFVQADATRYLLPAEPCLVFMFNPFDAEAVGKFLFLNADRIKASHSLLAYANDLHIGVLADAGFECLFRESTRSISLWR